MQKIGARLNHFAPGAQIADSRLTFAAALATYVIAAGLLAFAAPIQLKVLVVFLFAGPHNWVEMRYMLSRLPARWKKSRSFFATSFVGLAVLSLSFMAIMGALTLPNANVDLLRVGFSAWGTALVGWLLALLHRRGTLRTLPQRLLVSAGSTLAVSACWLGPEWFSISLVYLHPLVSLAILDAELKRSKPQLVQPYRMALLSAPLFVCFFWWHGNATLPTDAIANLVVDQSGATMMPLIPGHFVISTLVFFDLLHYGVWLLAIPLISAGWNGFQPPAVPLASVSPLARRAVSTLLAVSTIGVVALWCCFSANYQLTYTVYFVLAIVHVLAELPFLIWSNKCTLQ